MTQVQVLTLLSSRTPVIKLIKQLHTHLQRIKIVFISRHFMNQLHVVALTNEHVLLPGVLSSTQTVAGIV